MSKVRILYCIDSVAADAGTEKQLPDMIRRLDKERFEVHLCCLADSPRAQETARVCSLLVLPLRSIYTWNGLRQIRRLRRYIKERRIQVVQSFMIKANIVGSLATLGLKRVVVIGSRLNLGYCMTRFYNKIFAFLDRYATRIFANAEAVKREVVELEKVSPDKVDVLYHGADMEQYGPGSGDPSVAAALGIPEDAKVVGIVANLRPVKDHALFLRAAKLVAERVPKAAFVLVGWGELRDELGRLARELGIAEKVFFTGGKGDVPDYLCRMSIGCLSSSSEGFSNAILEYMAAGLPVVATDVGGNGEAVEHGVTGYIVPHGDPAAFAAPIIALLEDERKRAEMAKRSLERCREKFEIGAAMRRYEEYYSALVRGLGQ